MTLRIRLNKKQKVAVKISLPLIFILFHYFPIEQTKVLKMKVLVTGAAGFIGSHLSEKLNTLGHEVIGLDNHNTYYSPDLKKTNANYLNKKGITVIDKDLTSPELATSLPKDLDCIFHCAAQPGIDASSSFNSYLTNNVIATENLVNFARQSLNLKLFVNIGTSSIYGRDVTCNEEQTPQPISNYGVTKLAAEQLVLAASRSGDFKACSLRLYSVYGSRERPDKLFTKLIDCALNNKKFPLFEGSLKHKRSFTHVSDIINGIVSCIGKEQQCNGEIINLGIDKEYTTKEGFDTVEKLLKTIIDIQSFPQRNGDQNRTFAIIDKAKEILNYNPTITLEQGITEQIRWFKKHNQLFK